MKDKGKNVMITISNETFDECRILAIRNKKKTNDLISEIVENYVNKKKEKIVHQE